MEVTLDRKYKKANYTIGKLYINGKYICDTCEDKDRGLTKDMLYKDIISKKVYGETAIPRGRYKINMDTVSYKFRYRAWAKPYNGKLPRLENVPGFEGVLIHVLNTASESFGCIGVGWNKVKGKVVESTKAFKMLMDEFFIPAKKSGEVIWITIK